MKVLKLLSRIRSIIEKRSFELNSATLTGMCVIFLGTFSPPSARNVLISTGNGLNGPDNRPLITNQPFVSDLSGDICTSQMRVMQIPTTVKVLTGSVTRKNLFLIADRIIKSVGG
jgi:hypothetical protein